MALKKAGAFPFGSVPVLDLPGQPERFAQSSAILRYAGKLAGLYPDNLVDALRADMVIAALEDL